MESTGATWGFDERSDADPETVFTHSDVEGSFAEAASIDPAGGLSAADVARLLRGTLSSRVQPGETLRRAEALE